MIPPDTMTTEELQSKLALAEAQVVMMRDALQDMVNFADGFSGRPAFEKRKAKARKALSSEPPAIQAAVEKAGKALEYWYRMDSPHPCKIDEAYEALAPYRTSPRDRRLAPQHAADRAAESA